MMPARSIALHLTLVLALIVGGVMGAGARVAHAMSMQGGSEIVICSTDGPRIVTLDADGREVENTGRDSCVHCADCGLMPAAALISGIANCPMGSGPEVVLISADISFSSKRTVPQSARGPPNEARR